MSDTDTPLHNGSLYDPAKTHATALREIETNEIQSLATPEAAKAVAAQFVPVFARYDMQPTDTANIAAAVSHVRRTPADAETVADWATKSKDYLRAEYGDDAGQVLADTQKLLAKDPAFKAYLEKTQLGSHPSVVRAMSNAAIAFRKAGKLK
jgi:hypothetical protein